MYGIKMFPTKNKRNIKNFYKKGLIKKRAIVLNTNGKYLFACGTMIINIIDKIKDFDNIIVYYSDIEEAKIQWLRKIDKRIICEEVTLEKLNKDFYGNEKIIENSTFVKRYTHLPFAKIKMFTLLDKYRQIIFFDLDMLILDNLDGLLSDENSNMIWRSDNQTIFDKISRHTKQYEKIIELELYKKITTPNGGLIILNRNFDYHEAFKIGKKFIKTSLTYHPYLIDELTFGYVASKLELKVNNVNGLIYNTFPNYLTSASKLPHFLGNYKPWLSEAVQLIFPQWGRYYKKYSEITQQKNNDIKVYENTYKLILGDKYYNTWLSLLNSFDFPESLKIDPDINKQILEIIYNDSLKYYLKCHFLFNSINIYMDIEKKFISNIDETLHHINSLLGIYKNLKFENLPEYFRLSFGECPFHEVATKFNIFYNETFAIRVYLDNINITKFKQVSIKSHFNKYLYLNDLSLKQTDNKDLANNLQIYLDSKKIFIKLADNDCFVKSINRQGKICLSEKINFFNCFIENDKLMIRINNNYLSARNDGSISLVPHCKEWECFKIEYISV